MDNKIAIRLFHILFVGILFIYVGANRENIYEPLFNVLFYLGILICFYHFFQLYNNILTNKSIWINLIHILIVGPILVLIGLHAKKTSRKWFEILLMLGFSAIGYHTYYIFH